jgi:hypothetical protein
MVVGNNELTTTKNSGALLAISIVMAMQRYYVGPITPWSTSRASLKATDASIGQVHAPYCPSGCHGQQI